MEIKRVEDNLTLCKLRKVFLDELAISAGKKQAIVKEAAAITTAKTLTKSTGKHGSTILRRDKTGGDGFFMTSVTTKHARGGDEEVGYDGHRNDCSLEDL